jgi:peptidoglycan/LPS O-acetylase OafA/YrhL
LGAWIAEAKLLAASEGHSMNRGSFKLLAVSLVLAALGCVAFKHSQYLAFQVWALAFAAYLFQVLDKPMRNSISVRGFSWIGEFSFSLYVVHLPIFVFLASVLFHSALQVAIWPSFGFVAVAVGVAICFYWAVERPAMAWAKVFHS